MLVNPHLWGHVSADGHVVLTPPKQWTCRYQNGHREREQSHADLNVADGGADRDALGKRPEHRCDM